MTMISEPWPLSISVPLFVSAAAIIGVCGVMLTVRAERLAWETGLGQAIVGAVFLGAMTSLSGLVTSLTAAFEGHPELSVSNAIGGIAVQTAFLAIADMFYRAGNLEHAAASETNMVQAAVLASLLGIALLAGLTPNVTLLGVHPMSVVLTGSYVFGLRLMVGAHREPMWHPRLTDDTQSETQEQGGSDKGASVRLWAEFLVLAAIVGIAGWVIARSGLSLSTSTGLSEGLVGTLFTAVTTSLPEGVVAIAAVRRGAVTLAVGDILGGNSFDVLFLSLSDVMFRGGSIYHAVTSTQSFWLALSLLMTTILLLGLLRREKGGIANIGFESVLVLILYLGGIVLLTLT
jgi:cation:H+ antiporter